ncbi:hypothetical protein QTP70_023504 [Hemibagrus guttatus]|uniref:Uncharacterized protein n=1 Tax=Hemibagrus guttatus TaxID=175788 RepID=A0AAE0Q347_9TELE|nr:hypothetical protein QTP70_023504 [Hemibagrus guttatus]
MEEMDTLLSLPFWQHPSDALHYSFIEASLNRSSRRGFAIYPVLQSYHLPTGFNSFNYAPAQISSDLLPLFTTVINGSLTSGHVPTAFKKARVIPILKKPALNPSDIRKLQTDTMASARISACLVDISSWMTAHQLKLNPSKTELLHPQHRTLRYL